MMAGVGVKNPEGAARNLARDDLEGMVLKQVKLGEVSACVA